MAGLRSLQWWAETLRFSAASAGWAWYDGDMHQIALWAAEQDLGKDDFAEALLMAMDRPVSEREAYNWRHSDNGAMGLRSVVEQLKKDLGVPLQRWPFKEQ